MGKCDVCGAGFPFSHGQYRGHVITAYKMAVCEPCYKGNWDGWGPNSEGAVLDHLKANGIPVPPRNAKGWLPRGD
jgi:hypothetical protein